MKNTLSHRQILGWLAVFGSALFFYLATVIIRWSSLYVEIEAPYFVFARFLLGFMVVSLTMLIGHYPLKPKKYHLLLGRTIANTVAVFCFYKAVEVSSLAEANILNMTYPLFVTLFSWVALKQQRDSMVIWVVLLAFAGVWLVLSPGDLSAQFQSGWGLVSGISAAFAMIYLNVSRRCHDSHTILFFMFGLGSIGIYLFFHQKIFIPNGQELFFLLACSVTGVLGQYLLTHGFRFVTAVEGSVISSSRIVIAALMGPVLVGEPQLTLLGWCGALLIFLANSFLAYRKVTVK